MGPLMASKTSAAVPSTSKINKVIPEDTLEDLIKSFKELKVKLTALRRDQRPNTSRSIEGSKGYVVRCIYCIDPNHKRSDCGSYVEALKGGIVIFRESRIRDATTDKPLETNFGRRSIKKLLEEKLDKTSFIQVREADTYHIKASQNNVEAISNTSHEVLISGA